MVPPAPAWGPLARRVLSPPAQRWRLASCAPPPPQVANQRMVPRPGSAPAPPWSLGRGNLGLRACPGAWGWGCGGMSRGFGCTHRDRKAARHGPRRLTLRTHSSARQTRPWEPAPDPPSLALGEPPPYTLRCPPRFARSPSQAAASFAGSWPAEHMGGTRAATRGPDSPCSMDAAQRTLSRETSPGLRCRGTLALRIRDRARACNARECFEPGQTPGVLVSTDHILLNVFFTPRPATPNTFFRVSLMSLPYMGSPCPRP